MRTKKKKREVFILLPNKQHLGCDVAVTARGQDVFNVVLELLGVGELLVFGLAVLRDSEYLFLDLKQKLSSYFGRQWNRRSIKVPFILFLRVQYYVESGRLILSSKVLQLYYTELRQKVLQSLSHHQESLFFQLAATALQAEVGDEGEGGEEEEGERERRSHYFLPEDYFPSWLMERRGRAFLLQHSPALHSELRGLSRRRAMLQFIREASRLQDGPVTFYRMTEVRSGVTRGKCIGICCDVRQQVFFCRHLYTQDKKEVKSLILLGVALKGVQIYQEIEGKQCLLHDFSWTDIDRLTFQGRRFEIQAAASRCLPKLVYYAPSRFHSKHVLRHLVDSHRLHISTRDTVHYVQQLEDMHGQLIEDCATSDSQQKQNLDTFLRLSLSFCVCVCACVCSQSAL
ncbi:FERM domain-containing protein 6-like [Genypterus blacodes]|uniref:FERM domain-containing protein 6-like n=1 Tax=Genypterus blacodes TaxID=154954 RepID=UPI003F76CB3F